MPPIKRKPQKLLVPVEDVQPILNKLLAIHGSHLLLAQYLYDCGRGTSIASWRQVINRIATGQHKYGVDPEIVEILALEAGVESPVVEGFKQRIWRVTGYSPTGNPRKAGFGGMTARTWYYISRTAARKKAHQLWREGRFIEWAMADASWRVMKDL